MALLLCSPGWVLSCNPKDINWNLDSALEEYFESCTRLPLATEERLFTWGHQEKLARLQRDGYQLFSRFNTPQQYAYAGIQARSELVGFVDYPLFGKYLQLLQQSFGLMTVAELHRHSTNQESRERITKLWDNLTRDGKIPRPENTLLSPAEAGLLALAFDQVNPGFIDDLPFNVDELVAKTEERLASENDLDRATRRKLEGKLLGYQRAQQNPDTGKRSNISYGASLYLAAGPENFVEHYYNANHAGIACSLNPAADRITDLSSSLDTLVKKGHYLSTVREPKQPDFYPYGYNELSEPFFFRLAMQGRILKRGKNYADSGVIRYAVNGVCRDIRLDDFNNCESVAKLLRQYHFYGGSLYDFLVSTDEAAQLGRFKKRIERCTVSRGEVEKRANQRLEALPNTCVSLLDSGFQQGKFYLANKAFLDEVSESRCN